MKSAGKKDQLEAALRVLRGSYVDPLTEKTTIDSDLRVLERRLLRAITRDESGTVERDGFPGGGGLGVAMGTHGVPTENAALADGYADVVHNLSEAAFGYIVQAAQSVAAARKKMDELDVVSGITAEHVLPEESCESCARVKLAGTKVHSPMFKFSTVGGRLSRNWRLCGWCYDIVRRMEPDDVAKKAKGRAEIDADWLPNAERITQHAEAKLERKKAS